MSIKIDAEFHGKKRKADMYINYFPESCCGMDERVIQFFQELYTEGMKKYDEEMDKYWEKQHKEEIEAAEKAELKRLQKKYALQSKP